MMVGWPATVAREANTVAAWEVEAGTRAHRVRRWRWRGTGGGGRGPVGRREDRARGEVGAQRLQRGRPKPAQEGEAP